MNRIVFNLLVFLVVICVVTSELSVYRVCRTYAYAAEVPVECNGDQIEYFEKEKKIVGSGNVEVTYKDMKLICDRVTVWTLTKEVEAEGRVKLTQGESVLEGEKVIYNFEHNTGRLVNIKAMYSPWFAKGKSAERQGAEKLTIDEGHVTTCDHDTPHWKLSTKRVLIYPGKKVVVKNAVAWLNPFSTRYGLPVMWVPYYSHSLNDQRPHITVVPGKSSDWGYYALSAWRYNMNPEHKGYVRLDYREKKGLAYGVDHIYNTEKFGKGFVRGYYARERQLGRDHIWDKRSEGGPTIEEEKGLLRMRHFWDMSPYTYVIGELHKYKNENFIKDYFFNEYEKDEHPESYILLMNNTKYCNFSFLTKKRANRFDEVVERLPEVTAEMDNIPLLGSNFYYTGDFSAVNLNQVYPRHTDANPGKIQDPQHNNRYNAYNQLAYKAKVGFLSVMPYAGTEQTFYARQLTEEESVVRGAFVTGVDVSTKFFKLLQASGSDLSCSPFGIEMNGLRHVITPTAGYKYISRPTVGRENFFQFDYIDSLQTENLVGLGLENKLQTKRGSDMHSVDLATLLVETAYNFGNDPGREFTDYLAKLELRPYEYLVATSNAIFDSHAHSGHQWLRQLDNDLYVDIPGRWSLGVGHRYIDGLNGITLQGQLKMIPGWRFSIFENFDFLNELGPEKRRNEFVEQEYVITKDLHCWEMDIRYNIEKENGHQVMVIFRIKAFPDLPFEFGKSYSKPKIGSESDI